MRRILTVSTLLAALLQVPVGAQTSTSPNVMFIYVDDLNYDLGTFGHPVVQTPNMDSLAARGMSFSNAYCSFPVCGPSRLATLMGQHAFSTGLLRQNDGFDLPSADCRGVPALPKLFRQQGYSVAGMGKIFHNNQVHPDAWDHYFDQWRDLYVPYPLHPNPPAAHRLLYGGPYMNGPTGALGRLEDTKSSDEAINRISTLPQPWFIGLGYVAPHTPFIYPEAFDSLYDPVVDVPPLPPEEQTNWKAQVPLDMYEDFTGVEVNPAWGATEDERRRQAVVHYWRTITYVDHEIGRVVDHLASMGQMSNTIIVVVSDHGYSFGFHDRYEKIALYDHSVKAPLIVVVPSAVATAGQTCHHPVSHVDLYPTLVDYCGLPAPAGLQGRSLRPQLDDPTTPTAPAFAVQSRRWETRWLRMVRTETHKYVYHDDGGPNVLFDVAADPGEYENLIVSSPSPTVATIADDMRQLLIGAGFLGAHWHHYLYGSSGNLGVPELSLDGAPLLGSQPNLLVGNATGGPTAALLIGGVFGRRILGPAVFGGPLVIEPVTFTGLLLPTQGAAVPLNIPNVPEFVGVSYLFQTAQWDPTLPTTLAFSRGVRLFMMDY